MTYHQIWFSAVIWRERYSGARGKRNLVTAKCIRFGNRCCYSITEMVGLGRSSYGRYNAKLVAAHTSDEIDVPDTMAKSRCSAG